MWESRRLFQVSVGIRAFQRISIETAFSIGHNAGRCHCSCIFLVTALRALVESIALALHLNDLGVRQEAVENG